MNLSVSSHQARHYTVSTPVFEGPLALLLQLIERAELDITRLALAQVTDQYLVHLRTLEEQAAEEVSAFLVIAAKLLQIKSEALLPHPPARLPGEEDPGEALAMQLLAYKRYRAIAGLLAEREATGLRTHLRLAPPPKVEGSLDLSGLTLADLSAAAQAMLMPTDLRPALSSVVAPPRVTIREKIILLVAALRQRGQAKFHALFHSRPSRLEVVVTFLAMLELVKRHFVQVKQDQLFGEIAIEPAEAWDDEAEFGGETAGNIALEFGE